MHRDADMEVPGMSQGLDGVEQEIRDHLEDFTLFRPSERGFARPDLNVDPLFGNLLMVKAKCGVRQIDQVDLFRFGIQPNEGKTSARDLAQAAQLTIRLMQVFNDLE
jgi:hypothetical protein